MDEKIRKRLIKRARAARPTHERQKLVAHVAEHYPNLVGAAAGMVGWGTLLKVGGVIIALLGILGLFGADNMLIAQGGIALLVAGGNAFLFGVLLAAMGEGLLALGEIAQNTRETAKNTREAADALMDSGQP